MACVLDLAPGAHHLASSAAPTSNQTHTGHGTHPSCGTSLQVGSSSWTHSPLSPLPQHT